MASTTALVQPTRRSTPVADKTQWRAGPTPYWSEKSLLFVRVFDPVSEPDASRALGQDANRDKPVVKIRNTPITHVEDVGIDPTARLFVSPAKAGQPLGMRW